ncbi:hypothetical protein MEO_00597 [Candida albicans P94015]|nr:hypothetical protein MEO_00597 [Candida albicans P94015]
MLLLLVKNFNINIPFNFLEIVPFFLFFAICINFLFVLHYQLYLHFEVTSRVVSIG